MKQQHQLTGKVQQFIKQKGLLQPGQKIIVAVSGGIDSMVMLNLLVQLQQLWKLEIVVAHVNFQLRGKESDGDEQLVKKMAKEFGLPFYSEQTNAKLIAKKQKRSVQEAARDIRYSFFDTLKKSLQADTIATAHNANDNAETMLINLLRGSGLDGLAGIPPRRNDIVRPLLSITRKEIEQYAKTQKVKFRNDSSNAKDDYTRNFLRNVIIPQLEQRINPSLNETLLNEAEVFRAAANFTGRTTDTAFADCVSASTVDVQRFIKNDLFLQQSIIHRLLKELDIEPGFTSINSIVELATRQKGTIVEINKQWIAERIAEKIKLREKKEQGGFLFSIEKEGKLTTENFTITVKKSEPPDNKRHRDASIEYVDAAKVKFPLIVRSWKPGDVFIPLGMKGKKKLSDFFGEQKLATEEKNSIPIIESNGTIVWVAGKRLDERSKLTETTKTVYQLSIQTRQTRQTEQYNGKKNDNR
ncbi:MAG: tRNA lysidine(34) synthetase TilS [Bacteroidota bacterium]|nr:tRNA lysidine(34) synthetase TilS [Bacteroidota bacterium]